MDAVLPDDMTADECAVYYFLTAIRQQEQPVDAIEVRIDNDAIYVSISDTNKKYEVEPYRFTLLMLTAYRIPHEGV